MLKKQQKNAKKRKNPPVAGRKIGRSQTQSPKTKVLAPSPHVKRVQNKPDTRGRNRTAIPVYALIFGFVFLYIVGYTIRFATRKNVQFDTIQYGAIDTPNVIRGVVIRDEQVYSTASAGLVDYEVGDNEKVKKGTVVCNIKDEKTADKMESDLKDINESIMQLQSSRGGLSVYSEDVRKSNEEIKTLVENSVMNFSYGDVSGMYELMNSVQSKMDDRNELLLSESKGDVAELVSRRREQEGLLSKSILKIAADEGGIVSYYLDGKEADYNITTMQELTEKQTLVNAAATTNFKSSVEAGTPVFKIIKSNTWYIAAYIPNTESAQWKIGDNKTLYIKGDDGNITELNTVIQKIGGPDNAEKKYVVFRATKSMTDYISQRGIKFETKKTLKGYKVPNSAIVEETLLKIPSSYISEEGTVNKVDGETIKQVRVEETEKDEENGFSYIPMQLGEINVGNEIEDSTTGDRFKIEDVKNTKGIYVVNSGIAKFMTVNLENSVSNDTHTVLDDKLNTKINVYDRIMTNTDNVNKEDNVYQ